MASVTISVTFFTAFFTFGLNGAFSRIYFDIDDVNEKDILLNTAFVTSVTLSTVIIGLLLVTNGLFLNFVFKSVKYDPFLRYSLYISYLNIFSVSQLSLLLVKGKALKYRILTSSYFILNTFFTLIYLCVLKEGVIGILKGQIISNFIMAVYYLLTTVKFKLTSFNSTYSKKLLLFGVPIMIYTITGLLIEQSSKFFVERFLNLKELGIYNLAYQFSSVIILVNSAINMAWVPVYFEESRKNENSPKFNSFAKYLFQIASFLALCIAVFHKYILHFLLNDKYRDATNYVPLFVYVFVITNTYWILFINPIFHAKKTKYLPFISLFAGLVSIVTCIFLIPIFGLYGATLSVLVGNGIMNLLGFFVVNKFLPLRYDHLAIFSIIITSVLFFLVSLLIKSNNQVFEIFMKAALVVTYVFSLIYFKYLDVSELKKIFQKNNN